MRLHQFPGKKFYLIGLILFIILGSVQSAFSQASPDTKRIVVICSDSVKFPGYMRLIQGFEDRLKQVYESPVEYSYEYLDWGHHASDPTYLAKVADFFQQKYANPRPDLVVLVMDPAIQMVLNHRPKAFQDVPTLLLEYNLNLTPADSSKISSKIATLHSDFDGRKAIELILRLHPKTETIYLVSGQSEREQLQLSRDYKGINSFLNRVNISFLTGDSLQQLMDKIRSIDGKAVILYHGLIVDGTGARAVPAEVAGQINRTAKVPVYIGYDSFLGTGAIGGYVKSVNKIGTNAAEFAAQLFAGESQNQTYQGQEENAEYVFDWRALQRWGIDEAELPPGSRIEFKKPDVWSLYKWYIVSGIGLLLLQSVLIAALLIHRAKRKRAEGKLQEKMKESARDRLRIKLLTAGLETSSNLVVILDEHWCVWWVNAAFEELSGYTMDELNGKEMKKLLSPQNDPELFTKIDERIGSQCEWRGEIIACSKDGRNYVDEVSVIPILGEAGETSYFLIVGQDITEKVKAREAIQVAQEARIKAEKIFSIGTMAAGISHEINQPLNSIKVISGGILYLLAQGEKLQTEEFSESIKAISSQTDRIANIIKHLRSFFRRDENQRAPCDTNAAVDMALEMVGKQIADHGVTVHKDLQENLPQVMASPTGLEEIIVNLLVNALQALDSVDKKHKEITVRTYLSESIVLEIIDNGPGIDPSLENKIFETFVSTKHQNENLGLGLAIVNNIVHSYSGTIQVSSNEMSGATFTVAFPAVQKIDVGDRK